MLCVLINGRYAADLKMHRRSPTLRYTDEYARHSAVPLSSRFPVAGIEAGGPGLRNWLLNLLPDDGSVLNHLRSEFGVIGRDPLLLLKTPMGADCAGAVQFCPPEDAAGLLESNGGEVSITDIEIAEWLRDYPVLPARMEGTRGDLHVGFSLAGMQPKIALRTAADGTWKRPWGSVPTSHILKAARTEYPDECIFEHIAMESAAKLGIPSAKTAVTEVDGLQVIVVARFDRVDGSATRIHQEDTCQALGVPPTEKYERHNGPGVADLRRLASNDRSPAGPQSVDRLRDMLIYHWLIVNNDAHAKNYSWMFAPDGSHALAPLYDTCSWLPYRGNRQIRRIPLAMSMGNGFNLKTCDKNVGIAGLADKLQRPTSEICERITELADGLPAALESAVAALPDIDADHQRIERHVEELRERADTCQRLAAQMLQAQRRVPLSRDIEAAQTDRATQTHRAKRPRCTHIGTISKKRCVRPVHQDKNHRYT